MEYIEVDADIGLLTFCDQGKSRVQAGADGGLGPELQSQPDVKTGRPLGRLFQGNDRTGKSRLINSFHEIGNHQESWDAKLLAEIQPAAKVIVVGLALFALRKK